MAPPGHSSVGAARSRPARPRSRVRVGSRPRTGEPPPAHPGRPDHVRMRPEDEPRGEIGRVVIVRLTAERHREHPDRRRSGRPPCRLERADRVVEPERSGPVERPKPKPIERRQHGALVVDQRPPRHLRVRASPHDREDRGVRAAGNVRPEPDRQPRPQIARQAASRPPRGTGSRPDSGRRASRCRSGDRALGRSGGWHGRGPSATPGRRLGRRCRHSRGRPGRAGGPRRSRTGPPPGGSATRRRSIGQRRRFAEHPAVQEIAKRGVTA